MRFIATLLFGMMLAASSTARAQEAGTGWLGVELADITKEEADVLGWEVPRGAKVVKPWPGSPAEAAGIQAGDVLVTLDGVEMENVKAFIEAVSKKAAGTEIRLAISRAGREKRLAVKLGARTAQFAAKPKAAEDAPIPILDTGGHMSMIRDIAFTPDGRQLVSAGDDKVIRVWDVATGKTVRTLHGEAAAGSAGKVFAMALSPDGKWLAVGGRFANEAVAGSVIRLYDFASGRLVALLKGHENVVTTLAFSPDGRRLISGSHDKTAIIWDVAPKDSFVGRDQSDTLRPRSVNIAPVIAPPLHRLRGHMDGIDAVGFTPDGARAVTGSQNHELRLWSVESGESLQTMTGHQDEVRSLAVAPDGTIASGDFSGEIRLWDGKTGAFLKVLARQKTEVGNLSFSPDGKRLLSGAGEGAGSDCHVYDTASGSEIVTYDWHDSSVLATAISPDGRWAATGGGDKEEIHIWDLATAERRTGPDGQPLTLGGSGRSVLAVGFSTDGWRIGWGNRGRSGRTLNDRGQLKYALTVPAGDAPVSGPVAIGEGAFLRAVTEQNGWSLQHRKGGNYGHDAILDVKQDGRQVAAIERDSTDGYGHWAYTFTPDGETIISGGGNGVLTAYDRTGNKLGNYIGHEGVIWAVATSPDGRYLVSGAADQTLRLWNLKSRELLVTLYRGADGEWVMWTPQGYYASSPAGAELIGWQINKGPENAADYVAAAQLRTKLNRPDIVAKAIQLASAEDAVRQAPGTNFKLSDLLAKPAPRFSIAAPAASTALTGGQTQLELDLLPTADPVKLIRIQVNGTQIAEHLPADGPGFKPGRHKFPVPLNNGNNIIRAIAINETGETPQEVTVTHNGEGALDKRGTLYILAIGVDKYPNLPKHDLSYSGADAKAFAEAMEARSGPLHQHKVTRILVNGAAPGDAPTAANILDALALLREAGENDTVMVFIAGHGVTEGGNYRFLPTDTARLNSGGFRPSSVVPWSAVQEALESTKGRRILFLDTCRSGNGYSQRLTNDAYQANIIVYAAARWDQDALEHPGMRGGHGLFTLATMEGVEGKAQRGASGGITTHGLRDYLVERVRELATNLKQEQEPQFFRARDAGDYLLARGQ